jgi:hypothetical protein
MMWIAGISPARSANTATGAASNDRNSAPATQLLRQLPRDASSSIMVLSALYFWYPLIDSEDAGIAAGRRPK